MKNFFASFLVQFTCKNINWVSPVVSWFISSIDIKDASILPAVEFQESDSYYSEQWIVGKHNRSNSRIISKDEIGNPQYGGTVNDQSIIMYLDELKKRNLKIMFYPMLFVDLPNKPWRGRITGSSNDIYEFFYIILKETSESQVTSGNIPPIFALHHLFVLYLSFY